MASASTCILLILPLPIYRSGEEFFLDRQACNGLRLWLENFDRVIMCNPLYEGMPPEGTQSLKQLIETGALRVEPLPVAYTPLRFATCLPAAKRRLERLIDQSTHLQFAIGGLFGDWAAVATLLAVGRRRKVAVWTDRVESAVLKFRANSTPQPRRIVRQLHAWFTQHYERHVIRRAAMGLFHGMDTFTAYSRYNRDSQLVHDIHLGPEARISENELTEKSETLQGPLQIVYAGRVHSDKGFGDWISVLAKAKAAGVHFEATWYGDGPGAEQARFLANRAGVSDRLKFPGPVHDHGQLLEHISRAHIFLFCHKTAESPRCLVEALLSGTPIVGYESAYARDLILENGGGLLSTSDDMDALADFLLELDRNRPKLAQLFRKAAKDGFPFTDRDVFRHRSRLIKEMTAGLPHTPLTERL